MEPAVEARFLLFVLAVTTGFSPDVRSRIVRGGSTHCHTSYTTILRSPTARSLPFFCTAHCDEQQNTNNKQATIVIQNKRKHHRQHSRTFSFRSSDPRETKVKEMVSMRLCLTFVFAPFLLIYLCAACDFLLFILKILCAFARCCCNRCACFSSNLFCGCFE